MADRNGHFALLRFLVRARMLAEDLAQTAEAQMPYLPPGATLIDFLRDKGAIDEGEFAKALASRLHLPFVDLPSVAVEPSNSSTWLREELVIKYKVVPTCLDGQTLTIAMANPLDHAAVRAIESSTRKQIRIGVAAQTAVRDAIDQLYPRGEADDRIVGENSGDGVTPIPELPESAETDGQEVEPDSPLATSVNPSVSANSHQFRALVVDDHADMRRLISVILEHSGIPILVRTAENGTEALECAAQDPPDLVVLDLMMPGVNGFEVCQRLRENVCTSLVPILMLTARNDVASRTRSSLVGADDYVHKPFARAELIARVRRLIERTYGALLTPGSEAALKPVSQANPGLPGTSLRQPGSDVARRR